MLFLWLPWSLRPTSAIWESFDENLACSPSNMMMKVFSLVYRVHMDLVCFGSLQFHSQQKSQRILLCMAPIMKNLHSLEICIWIENYFWIHRVFGTSRFYFHLIPAGNVSSRPLASRRCWHSASAMKHSSRSSSRGLVSFTNLQMGSYGIHKK